MPKQKSTYLDLETGLLLNEVRGIMLQKNPSMKGIATNIIKEALAFYKKYHKKVKNAKY